LDRADLFVAVGLDPVELLPRPWKFRQPVISINGWPMERSQIPVVLDLVGDVVALLDSVAGCLTGSEWEAAGLPRLVADQRERMRPGLPGPGPAELLPHRVVELVAEAYPGVRATVDAGAHMFPVMSLWPAEEPSGVLISNGLSTMGFALPAAIGAALLQPSRPIVVFTGDGGLLMCVSELRTAARERLPLRIIVFQDDELSLIKIKQEQRGYRTDGVSIGEIDWRLVANGFGVKAQDAITETHLRSCLHQTADYPGPVLIAAKISAGSYAATIRALRG
jgi:acetolactate synthase-1/2/3 large subunit